MSKSVGKIPRGPRILLSLLATGGPMDTRQIAGFLGVTTDKVAPYLTRLAQRKLVRKLGCSVGASQWRLTRAGRVLANGQKKLILQLAAMLEAK